MAFAIELAPPTRRKTRLKTTSLLSRWSAQATGHVNALRCDAASRQLEVFVGGNEVSKLTTYVMALIVDAGDTS